MRIKVTKGPDPTRLCRYLLADKKCQVGKEFTNPIFFTNMVGQTVAELGCEFRFISRLNPRVKKPIAHYSISFPPGENPALETKQAMIQDLLTNRGHHRCQFLAVEHFDQQHKRNVHHLHVAVATVRYDGSWVNDSFERLKLKAIERELEQQHHLQRCPPRPKGERINLTTGECRQEERTGQASPKRQLWQAIDRWTATPITMPLLIAHLKAEGVGVRLHEFSDQKMGLSFQLEGSHFSGRQLGERYSFNGLQQYAGVNYDGDRDDDWLRQIDQMSSDECRSMLELEQPQALGNNAPHPATEPELHSKPIPESPNWEIAQFLLSHTHDRLRQAHRSSASNDRYWAKQEEDGSLSVGRLGETEPIAQGKLAKGSWEIAIAMATLDDQQAFLQRQQAEQQRDEWERARKDRGRSNSRGFELE